MAYDEDPANPLRELLAGEGPITEKKMFGGLAFLLEFLDDSLRSEADVTRHLRLPLLTQVPNLV